MSINYVNLVCDITDGSGNPVETGTITFIPNSVLTDTTDHITITQLPVVVSLLGNPSPAVQLAATDNSSLSPSGWSWLIAYYFPGAPARKLFLLPYSAGATQYLSDIATVTLSGYLPESGGTMAGALTLAGTPPLAIPAGAVAGNVLTSDVSGNASWQASGAGVTLDSTSADIAALGTRDAGSVGKAADAGHVHPTTGLVLASALPLAITSGGTGQATAAAAITALTGTQSAGKVLRSDGTNAALATIQAGDVPTLNQSTTGSAASANALNSATTTVSVSAATAPTSGQALVATSGTAATWQTITGGGGGGIAPPAGDIGGSAGTPTVVATHLSSALPVNQGGTGAATLTGLVTGNGTSAMTAVTAPSGTVVGTSDTQTLTAKRVNPRTATLTVSGSTYTPAGDSTDLALIASPTANFTVAAPSGTPVDGQKLLMRITSGGTGFTPTWNSAYLSSGAATLPAAALPSSKTVTLGFTWDASASKWILLALDGTGY